MLLSALLLVSAVAAAAGVALPALDSAAAVLELQPPPPHPEPQPVPQASLYPLPRAPLFAYRCNDKQGACVKSGGENASAGAWEDYAWSLPACQVRCGRAGALWPLPTGAVQLGAGLAAVSSAPGRLLLPAGCAGAGDVRDGATLGDPPRLRRLLEHAHRAFLRRLQAEEAASRALSPRGRARAAPAAPRTQRLRPRQADAGPGSRLDVEICVETDSLTLDWSTDESYVLEGADAAEGGRLVAKIRAATFFGARHALETLSQLVAHTGPQPDGSSDGHLVLVAQFAVADAPAFPHRGLLLDTSRNYYTPAFIRATINAMAQNKLNVLHWHITDSQSFPYESSSLPQMAAFGAFSARQTYPAQTVRELSRFALSRGVLLLPELDAPAHVAAGWEWGRAAGLGDLVVCAAQQPWARYCVEPPCGQLNPANANVYHVLAALFQDMLRDFYDAANSPAPFFHMGGDEVHTGCWNSSREVVDYMARVLGRPRRRKEDFIALWGHFQARATAALDLAHRGLARPDPSTEAAPTSVDVDADGQANSVLRRRQATDENVPQGAAAVLVDVPGNIGDEDGLRDARSMARQDSGSDIPVILWTSELTAANVVEKYLDKDRYVIQLWLRAGDPLARDLVSKGYRVIVSTKDAWYLDHGFGNWKGNSTSGYGYHPWQTAYDNEPLAGLGPDAARQVLGGEAAMWGEQADQSGASTKMWPRAAAVAERLWSGSRAGGWTAARVRFVRHRDRMARLGTPSEAVQPEWCTQHEGQCY